jgi:hypothetical protein
VKKCVWCNKPECAGNSARTIDERSPLYGEPEVWDSVTSTSANSVMCWHNACGGGAQQ